MTKHERVRRTLWGCGGWMALLALLAGTRCVEAELMLGGQGESLVVGFDGFRGGGFSSSPIPGQLDSTEWRVGGLSDGGIGFGETSVSGDFARGTSNGSVTTGGVYAFEVRPDDWALGVQPTSSDLQPGLIEVRVTNGSSDPLVQWDLAFDLYWHDDQTRSSRWEWAASADGTTFIPLGSHDFASAGRNAGTFQKTTWSRSFDLPVDVGQPLFVRWTTYDLSGSGGRDEFALDQFTLTAIPDPSPVPEPSTGIILMSATLGLGWIVRRNRKPSRCVFSPTGVAKHRGMPNKSQPDA